MPEIRPLSPLPATRNFFSVNYSTNVCSPFKSRLRAYFDFYTEHTASFPDAAPGNLTKTVAEYPLSKTCFSPEIMPFSCPENAPQKCKWLQCVRLVINKRRPSADVAADAATSPARFARGRRPSAHTFTNKSPLNRSNLIAQKHRNPETRLRDEKRGGERSRPR